MSAFRRRPGARPLVHGHRGVRGPAPENTLRAFERAKQEGADGVELDVRLARSGEVVVFHDPDLRRMTQGFDSRMVAALDARALARIDLGGERVATLAEVLDWITPTTLLLNVEMKRDVPSRPALVWALARALRARTALRDRLLVSSFDPAMLAPLSVLLPGAKKALLFHAGQARLRPWTIAKLGPWQAVHPEHVMIEGPLQLQRVVNAWTVNDPERARELASFGVDGLITDRPGAILQALNALPQTPA